MGFRMFDTQCHIESGGLLSGVYHCLFLSRETKCLRNQTAPKWPKTCKPHQISNVRNEIPATAA